MSLQDRDAVDPANPAGDQDSRKVGPSTTFPPGSPGGANTDSVPGFFDTFTGSNNKRYVDWWARNLTRLRGVQVYYYTKEDQTRRIDGDRPLGNRPEQVADPLLRRLRAGNVSLYGEPVQVGRRLDSVRREVSPVWALSEPIEVRGLVYDISTDEQADERGAIYARTCTLDLARVLCEEWGIRPRQGDVVRLPRLLNQYFDVEDVSRDSSRYGGTGFHSKFELTLSRSSKYEPQRKLPDVYIILDEDTEKEEELPRP